jgi:hypothetical protein
MNIPLTNVINFALEQSTSLLPEERAALFRDVAAVCGDENEAAHLIQLANQLDRIEELCRAYMFRFSQTRLSESKKGDEKL